MHNVTFIKLLWSINLSLINPTLSYLFAASVSKAAFLGIGVGGLVILFVILVAACWPHSSLVLKDISVSKPGDTSIRFPLCCF
jgi:hypothetical protein